MAASNKNIIITPNTGQTTAQPNIVWTGNAAYAMTTVVADDNSLFWQNATGQLFSISNNLTSGTIFSVNDISGIPFISVNASGNVSLNPLGGANVGIGTASPQFPLHVFGSIVGTTSASFGNIFISNTTAATSTTTGALVVAGGVGIAGNLYASSNVVAASFQPTGVSVPPNGMYLPNTNTLSFATNNTQRATIAATGQFLVGTSTAPSGVAVWEVINNTTGGGIEWYNLQS